jgi:hypothetical protein
MDLFMDPLKIREQVTQQLYQHDPLEDEHTIEFVVVGSYHVMGE